MLLNSQISFSIAESNSKIARIINAISERIDNLLGKYSKYEETLKQVYHQLKSNSITLNIKTKLKWTWRRIIQYRAFLQ